MTDPSPGPRLAHIDALRGLAIAQMIAYHAIYDLGYFGWLHLAMTRDPPWIAWRTAIVAQFLLLVGIGLVLREARGIDGARFWRRWAQIAGAALLVSAGSRLLFGPRFIWFGILHFVAVALVLGRSLASRGWRTSLLLAAISAGVGLLLRSTRFDADALSWIGFATIKPGTEDFVPVFPWLGAVFAGMALGIAWRKRSFRVGAPLEGIAAHPPPVLAQLGRWPLTVYLVHQPLLMGFLWLVRRLAG